MNPPVDFLPQRRHGRGTSAARRFSGIHPPPQRKSPHTAASRPTAPGKQSLAEKINHGFSCPSCLVRELGSAAPGVRDVGHHEICPLQHPAITPVDGVAWMDGFHSLREEGVGEIIVFVLLAWHIGQHHGILNLRVRRANSRRTHRFLKYDHHPSLNEYSARINLLSCSRATFSGYGTPGRSITILKMSKS